VLLNVSGGKVINALRRCDIDVRGGDWEEDFEIDMPDGVSASLHTLMYEMRGILMCMRGDDSSFYARNASGEGDAIDIRLLHVYPSCY
jgi:hypothetical protein